jgi:hypothetical protein
MSSVDILESKKNSSRRNQAASTSKLFLIYNLALRSIKKRNDTVCIELHDGLKRN